MTVDVVSLGFEIDSSKLAAATTRLDDMARAAPLTGRAVDALTRSMDRLSAELEASAQAHNLFTRAVGLAREALVAFGVYAAGRSLKGLIEEATLAAARFETLGIVINRVGQNTRFTQEQLFQQAVGIQRMGIAMVESRQAVIQMVQAQLDLSKATQLARVAQDAAVIGNLNSTETLGRLIHAISSGYSEEARYVGLQVSFEAAYAKMAATIGKTEQSLTEAEKAQARMNAIIDAGVNIAGSYEAAMGTAGKQLNSMKRYVDDLLTTLGQAFLPVFTQSIAGTTATLHQLQTVLNTPTGRETIDAVGQLTEKIVSFAIPAVLALTAAIGVRLLAAAVAAFRPLQLLNSALSFASASPIIAGLSALTGILVFALTRQDEYTKAIESGTEAYKRHEEAARDTAASVGQLTAAQIAAAKEGAELVVRQRQRDVDATREQISALNRPAAERDTILGLNRDRPELRQAARQAPDRETRQALIDLTRISAEVATQNLSAQQLQDRWNRVLELYERINKVLGDSPAWRQATAEIDKQRQAVVGLNEQLDAQVKAVEQAKEQVTQAGRPIPRESDSYELFVKQVQASGFHYDQNQGLLTSQAGRAEAQKSAFEDEATQLKALVQYYNDIANDPRSTFEQFQKAIENASDAQKRLNILLGEMPVLLGRIATESETAFGKNVAELLQRMEVLQAGPDPVAQARVRARQQALGRYIDPLTGQQIAPTSEINSDVATANRLGYRLAPVPSTVPPTAYTPGTTSGATPTAVQGASGAPPGLIDRMMSFLLYQESKGGTDYSGGGPVGGGPYQFRADTWLHSGVPGVGTPNLADRSNPQIAEQSARTYLTALMNRRLAAGEPVEQAAMDALADYGVIGSAGGHYDPTWRPQITSNALAHVTGASSGGAPGSIALPGGPGGTIGALADVAGDLAAREAALQRQVSESPQISGASIQALSAERLAAAQGQGEAAVRKVREEIEKQVAAQQFGAQLQLAELKAVQEELTARGQVTAEVTNANRATQESLERARAQGNPQRLAEIQQQQAAAALQRQFGSAQPGLADAQQDQQSAAAIERFAAGRQQLEEQLRTTQLEATLQKANSAERETQLNALRIQIEYEKAVAGASSDQVKAAIDYRDRQLEINDALGKAKEALQESNDLQQGLVNAAGDFATKLEQVALHGGNIRVVMGGILSDIAKIGLDVAVNKPIEKYLDSQLSDLFGGGSGSSGSGLSQDAFGSGTGSTGGGYGSASAAGAFGSSGSGGLFSGLTGIGSNILSGKLFGGIGDWIGSLFGFAKGDVFHNASGLSAYRNTVVAQPTYFRFAAGAGLMGEAGPEGILPLARTSDGSLGVRTATGRSAAGGGANINLNVGGITVHGPQFSNGQIDPTTSSIMSNQFSQVLMGALKSALVDESRTGGILGR